MRPSRNWLLLPLIFSLALASCDRDKNKTASTDKPKPLIGVSLLTLTNPFFKEMGDTMRAEGEKRGYEVVITSGEFDPANQKDQVKDFLVRKASAIILTPCDSKSVGTAIIEANSAGVPVFTADIASIAPGAKVVCHIATDNYEGGKVAGRAMVELLNGKGKVAILDHPEVESVLMRTKGFSEEVAKAPGIQIVARLPGGGARDRSFAAAQDILQAHSDLDAIFAINDPSALGAIAAIEKAAKIGRIKVIGFDGQPEAKQAVKDGKMYATVLQHPQQIATATIEAIAKYMSGERVPPQNLIPTALYRQADAQTDAQLK
jgi:ribose transport system substrate-binding protein